jgi:hypothetical protein
MPRQNRVTPYGEIISTSARGTFMGNRGGCLHDDGGRLGLARWRSPQWITCLLEFRGRRRTVMTPRRYTELFFLDEATALAAGHRPCAECRREAFNEFKRAWLQANPRLGHGARIKAPELDRRLHAERVTRRREKVTHQAAIEALPDGVFILLPDAPEAAFLLWQGNLHRWSPAGYTGRRPRAGIVGQVDVLTPLSTVNAIAAGYTPAVHKSAVACT